MSARGSCLVQRTVLVEPLIWHRLGECARTEKVSRGVLLRRVMREAVEGAEPGAEGMSRSRFDRLEGRVDDLFEELRDQVALIAAVGRVGIGVQQLLIHWATREEVLGVGEDELLAQVQVAGEEGWSQFLDELRPRPQATQRRG